LSLPIVGHVLRLPEGDDRVPLASERYCLIAVVDQRVWEKEHVPRPELDDQFELPQDQVAALPSCRPPNRRTGRGS
jgi:hypothetical protein